jgi:hypothetical protein
MFVVFNQIFSAVTAREMEVDRLANFGTFVAKLRFPLGRRDACQGCLEPLVLKQGGAVAVCRTRTSRQG